MGQAARAIIIENNNLLIMHRNKQGSQYFTLVGGQAKPGEELDQTVRREVKEETGLDVTSARLVYVEKHPAPYNEQYIYLCEVAPHADVKIQEFSEEAMLNRLDVNIHTPGWAHKDSFATLAFRTPQLQEAILKALKKGFPGRPVQL